MKTIYDCEVEEKDIQYIQPSLRIFAVPIDDLSLDPKNARVHKQKSIDAIASSLKKFGQQTPIVFSEDRTIKKGNGTFEAAKMLGWKWIAAFQSNLSGNELDAWAVADNRTTELSSWNEDMLSDLITKFESEDTDLVKAIGFDEKDLAEMFNKNEKENNKEPAEKLMKMELRPYEHYDYVLLLSDNTYDWNFLMEYFDLQKVNCSYGTNLKIGRSRAVRAGALVEKINEMKSEINRLKKELENGRK